MKFRGKITEILCIHQLTRVVATISKLSKVSVLRLTKNNVYFIVSQRATSGGSAVWCELLQDHFFSDYLMEGLSEEFDEIYLEISLESLHKVMKSTLKAKLIKLKLTKKHGGCLTIEVELPSMVNSANRLSVHDIPVVIVPRRLWEDYEEPNMPDCDISITLTSLKIIKNVIEKMKNLSNFVTLTVTDSGEMMLNVETDLVSVTTKFKDLLQTNINGHRAESVTQNVALAEVRVDIRKLFQFLACEQITPSKVVCNIINERMIQLCAIHTDVSIQYFLPIISQ